jgi:replication factor C subunit 1
VTTTPSSKTTYVVVGEDAGESKLEKIKRHNIPTLSEDGFLDLIRGAPAKSDEEVMASMSHKGQLDKDDTLESASKGKAPATSEKDK